MTSARWPVSGGSDQSQTLVLGGHPLPLVSRMRVYTCGITPYDVTHLGHAAVFVWTDLLRSVARLLSVQPVMARNITDVDDVLSDAASRAGRRPDEYAVIQEFNFDQDMTALGVAAPDAGPHAHAHVAAVVQLAQGLLVRERAYERHGYVFFRGADVPARLGLSRERALSLSEEFGDQREQPVEREDALDVAVWRPSDEGQPAWPSPWGWGRPGWHAECSAMALTAHGASVDVLVGGADLAFPHHAHQAAMIEAVTGVSPFTRQHLHVGTVGLDGAKMAKSTGNLVLVRDLVARHPAGAVRLLLLNRPWAAAWDFEESDLVAAEQLLGEIYAAAGRTDRDDGSELVVAALLDDLDVPRALAVALEHGGKAARLLVRVLGLGDSD